MVCCFIKTCKIAMIEKVDPGFPQLQTSYSAHLNITVVIRDIRPIIQLEIAKAAAPELGPRSPYLEHQYIPNAAVAMIYMARMNIRK